MTVLWIQRNRSVHKHESTTPDQELAEAQQVIRRHLRTVALKEQRSGTDMINGLYLRLVEILSTITVNRPCTNHSAGYTSHNCSQQYLTISIRFLSLTEHLSPHFKFGDSYRIIMRTSFFPLMFMVAFATSKNDFVAAEEKAVARLRAQDDETNHVTSDNDERDAIAETITNLNSFLHARPSKAKIEERGAREAFNWVKGLIGSGKTTTELTAIKAKQLEIYTKQNTDKWYAMSYYLSNTFGISLVVFLLFGTFYLGWRPVGLGGYTY